MNEDNLEELFKVMQKRGIITDSNYSYDSFRNWFVEKPLERSKALYKVMEPYFEEGSTYSENQFTDWLGGVESITQPEAVNEEPDDFLQNSINELSAVIDDNAGYRIFKENYLKNIRNNPSRDPNLTPEDRRRLKSDEYIKELYSKASSPEEKIQGIIDNNVMGHRIIIPSQNMRDEVELYKEEVRNEVIREALLTGQIEDINGNIVEFPKITDVTYDQFEKALYGNTADEDLEDDDSKALKVYQQEILDRAYNPETDKYDMNVLLSETNMNVAKGYKFAPWNNIELSKEEIQNLDIDNEYGINPAQIADIKRHFLLIDQDEFQERYSRQADYSEMLTQYKQGIMETSDLTEEELNDYIRIANKNEIFGEVSPEETQRYNEISNKISESTDVDIKNIDQRIAYSRELSGKLLYENEELFELYEFERAAKDYYREREANYNSEAPVASRVGIMGKNTISSLISGTANMFEATLGPTVGSDYYIGKTYANSMFDNRSYIPNTERGEGRVFEESVQTEVNGKVYDVIIKDNNIISILDPSTNSIAEELYADPKLLERAIDNIKDFDAEFNWNNDAFKSQVYKGVVDLAKQIAVTYAFRRPIASVGLKGTAAARVGSMLSVPTVYMGELVNEGIKQGMSVSNGDALSYGAAMTVLEMVTEMINPIEGMIGTGSVRYIDDVAEGLSNLKRQNARVLLRKGGKWRHAKDIIRDGAKHASVGFGAEALEEVTATVGQYFYEQYYQHDFDKSIDFDPIEAVEAGLVGGAVGLVGSSLSIGSVAKLNNEEYYKTMLHKAARNQELFHEMTEAMGDKVDQAKLDLINSTFEQSQDIIAQDTPAFFEREYISKLFDKNAKIAENKSTDKVDSEIAQLDVRAKYKDYRGKVLAELSNITLTDEESLMDNLDPKDIPAFERYMLAARENYSHVLDPNVKRRLLADEARIFTLNKMKYDDENKDAARINAINNIKETLKAEKALIKQSNNLYMKNEVIESITKDNITIERSDLEGFSKKDQDEILQAQESYRQQKLAKKKAEEAVLREEAVEKEKDVITNKKIKKDDTIILGGEKFKFVEVTEEGASKLMPSDGTEAVYSKLNEQEFEVEHKVAKPKKDGPKDGGTSDGIKGSNDLNELIDGELNEDDDNTPKGDPSNPDGINNIIDDKLNEDNGTLDDDPESDDEVTAFEEEDKVVHEGRNATIKQFRKVNGAKGAHILYEDGSGSYVKLSELTAPIVHEEEGPRTINLESAVPGYYRKPTGSSKFFAYLHRLYRQFIVDGIILREDVGGGLIEGAKSILGLNTGDILELEEIKKEGEVFYDPFSKKNEEISLETLKERYFEGGVMYVQITDQGTFRHSDSENYDLILKEEDFYEIKIKGHDLYIHLPLWYNTDRIALSEDVNAKDEIKRLVKEIRNIRNDILLKGIKNIEITHKSEGVFVIDNVASSLSEKGIPTKFLHIEREGTDKIPKGQPYIQVGNDILFANTMRINEMEDQAMAEVIKTHLRSALTIWLTKNKENKRRALKGINNHLNKFIFTTSDIEKIHPESNGLRLGLENDTNEGFIEFNIGSQIYRINEGIDLRSGLNDKNLNVFLDNFMLNIDVNTKGNLKVLKNSNGDETTLNYEEYTSKVVSTKGNVFEDGNGGYTTRIQHRLEFDVVDSGDNTPEVNDDSDSDTNVNKSENKTKAKTTGKAKKRRSIKKTKNPEEGSSRKSLDNMDENPC